MQRKNILSHLLIFCVRGYQYLLSPDQGIVRYFFISPKLTCCMYPSCSAYMILAIEKFGAFRGLYIGIRRITRCHPYQKKLVDFP